LFELTHSLLRIDEAGIVTIVTQQSNKKSFPH